jgi:DNA-binding transcriptional MerR regulator
VAKAAGVNLQTLRYYERRGLLPDPERSLGGHRVYPEQTVTTLRVIKSAQRLGFTLAEIGDLLDTTWQRHRGRSKPDLQQRAAEKVGEIEAKISDLIVIRDALRGAVDAGCDDLTSCLTNPDCPLSLGDLAHQDATNGEKMAT